MRKLLPLLCLLLTLNGCSGLPYPREMGDMALLRTMGVDPEEEGVALTVSTGPRARGIQGETEPSLVLSARGGSLGQAALALQGLSDSYVFFGYVDQLLLGEELTGQGVLPLLDYFARDVELGLGAQVWDIRGSSAREAVESGGEKGVEGRLSTLRTDGEMGVAAIARTAGEVYADLLEWGAAYLPALELSGEEGATLLDGGYAILKDGALAGYLEGEEARGLELLAGAPAAHVLTLTLPQAGEVTVRITGAVTVCRLTAEGGLKVNCRVTAHLLEYARPLTQEELGLAREQIRDQEGARLKRTLDRLRELETDCLGLGPQAGLFRPALWSSLEEDWPEHFARLEPEIKVGVELYE